MEQSGIAFLTKVQNGYYTIVNNNNKRYKLIDCNNRTIESINNEIITVIKDLYKGFINE